MVICVDVHDTLANYVLSLIESNGWPETWQGRIFKLWPDYDWKSHFSQPHHGLFLSQLKPVAYSVEGVWELYNSADQLIYLTAGGRATDNEITKRWIMNWNYPFGEKATLVSCGGFDEKIEIIRDLHKHNQMDWLIDDIPDFIRAGAEAGANVVVLNAPWNRFGIPGYNTFRAPNWLYVPRLIL